MSADPSTDPSGVSSDVTAGGRGARVRVTPADLAAAAGHVHNVEPHIETRAESGSDEPAGQNRRARRGRRRRGRRPVAAEPTAPAAPVERRDPPKPGPKPGPIAGRKPPEPAPAEDEPRPTHTRVSPPKPSDLVARTAKIAKTGLTHAVADSPSSGGAGKTRRRSARPEHPPEKLRTVRETSAGGLVISDLDLPVDELSAALIGRMDRRGRIMWSLPKGHIETGETAEQTAIREVAEETGIQGTVVAPLGKIDYWFVSEGRRIHKTVHHYLLRSIGGELSDADYEVSEVAWVPLRELPRRLTYSDERRLARMARGVIADLAADPNRLAQSEAESIRTEPNAYERAAAARNQRRNEPPPPARPRRRRRRPRRPSAGDA